MQVSQRHLQYCLLPLLLHERVYRKNVIALEPQLFLSLRQSFNESIRSTKDGDTGGTDENANDLQHAPSHAVGRAVQQAHTLST